MADQNTLPDWRQLPVVGSAPAANPAVPPSVLGGASAPADWRSLPVVGQVGGAAPAPAPEAAEPDWKKLPVVGQTTQPGGVSPATREEPQSDSSSPWYSKAWNWANAPLVDDQFLKQHFDIDVSDTRGWSRGLIDLAEGLSSPLSLALTIGSLGSLGELGAAGQVALRGAGLSEEALGQVVKGSEALTRAFRSGKAMDAAWEDVAKAGLNRGVIEDGLAKLKSFGLDERALFERNVVHRTTASMLRAGGMSLADAEKYSRAAAGLVDAGFTYGNASAALITMPRVLDALKDGDYDKAKELAVAGTATTMFGILGITALGREAGGMLREAGVSLGLGERLSDSLRAGARIFGVKTAEVARAGQDINAWVDSINKSIGEMPPIQREQAMKWIEAEGDTKLGAARQEYLIRATGKSRDELTALGILPQEPQGINAVFSLRAREAGMTKFQFPSHDELIQKYGATDDIANAAFLLPDGRMVQKPANADWTHDQMLGYEPKDEARESFINQTGAARIRARVGRAGQEIAASLPGYGATPRMREQLLSLGDKPGLGRVVLESADRLNPLTKVVDADRLEGGDIRVRKADIGHFLNKFDDGDLGWINSVQQDIATRGGTTWSPRLGRINKGYAFVMMPEWTKSFDHPVTSPDIQQFYNEHKNYFDEHPNLTIGAFKSHPLGSPDLNIWEINATGVTKNAKVAFEMARRLKEQYVARLSKIPLDGEPSSDAFWPTGVGTVARTEGHEFRGPGEQVELPQSEREAAYGSYGWGQRFEDIKGSKLMPEELTKLEQAQLEHGRERDTKFLKQIEESPELKELVAAIKVGMVGSKWYERSLEAFAAARELAPNYFLPEDADRFAGMIAALSNRRAPILNLRDALGLWKNWVDSGRPLDERQVAQVFRRTGLGDMPSKLPNLLMALKGEEMLPESRQEYFKVGNFAADLRGVMNHVALDQWMGIFFGLKDNPSTVPAYHAMTVLVRQAAKEMNMEPAQAQAAIWSFTRALGEISGWTSPKGGRYYRPTSMLKFLTPEVIGKYSEDFADIMASDHEVREKLYGLGVDLNELDKRLTAVTGKPPVKAAADEASLALLGPAARRIGQAQQRLERFKQTGKYSPAPTGGTPWLREDATAFGFGANQPEESGRYAQGMAGGRGVAFSLRVPGFYSQAELIAKTKLPNAGPGDSFLATLRNNGVKQQELEDLGLDALLRGRARVTRGELLQHIDLATSNLVQVNQGEGSFRTWTLQGGENYREHLYAAADPRAAQIQKRIQEIYDEMKVIEREAESAGTDEAWKQAGQRTFALSEERARLRNELNRFQEYEGGHFKGQFVGDVTGDVFGHTRTTDRTDIDNKSVLQIEEEQSDIHQKARDRLTKAKEKLALGGLSDRKREEYEELVRNRGYEPRYDISKYVARMEEIQQRMEEIAPRIEQLKAERGGDLSIREDRIGLGRNTRTRYVLMQGEMPIAAYDSSIEARRQLVAATMSPEETALTNERDTLHEELRHVSDQMTRAGRNQEPPITAPFKGSAYWEFMFKHMLRLAAEEGKDKLAWTTGDQQVQRYSKALRQQVDRIEYDRETKHLLATKSGRTVRDLRDVAPDRVSDYVGKSISEQLLKGQVVTGNDITVDSPGMRTFYDKMMPEWVNKYIKKWGGRVGETQVQTGETRTYEGPEVTKAKLKEFVAEGHFARHTAQEMIDRLERNMSPKNAWDFAIAENHYEARLLAHALGGRLASVPDYETVHSVEITPEMRKQIMGQGQAVYHKVIDPITAQSIRHSANYAVPLTYEQLQKVYGPIRAALIKHAADLTAGVGSRYIPRQGMTPGYIELNEPAFALLDSIFFSPLDKNRGRWVGATIEPSQLRIVDNALSRAQNNLGHVNPKASETIGELLKQFRQATVDGRDSGVAFAVENMPANVANEERFHGLQAILGKGEIEEHLAPLQWEALWGDEDMQKVFAPELSKIGYASHDPKLLVFEAAAHIGVGDSPGGTLEQQASFFTKYLRAVAERHGVDSIDDFKPTLSDEMATVLRVAHAYLKEQEQLNASVQRLGREGHGEVQGELQSPNEGVPGGQAEGRTGPGAGGPGGAGENPTGAAGPGIVRAVRAEGPDETERRMSEERIEEIIKGNPLAPYLTSSEGRDHLKHLFESYNFSNLTDQQKQLATQARDYFSESLERAQKAGVLNEGVEDYVTHMWQPGDEQNNEAFNRALFEARNGSFNLNTNMARKRLFMTAFEGELMGKKLAHTDPVALAAHNRNSFERVIANRKAYAQLRANGLKASDGRPVVALTARGTVIDEDGSNPAVVIDPRQSHSIRIADAVVQDLKAKGELDRLIKRGDIVKYGKEGDDNYAWRPHDYKSIDHQAMRDWVFAVSMPDGTPVYVRGDLKVHPEWASYVEKQLGVNRSPIRENPVGEKVLGAGRAAKSFLLAFSPFHVVQEGLRAVMTGVNPIGIEKPDLHDPVLFNGVVHGLTLGKDYRGVEEFEQSEGLTGHSKLVEKLPVVGQLQQKLETFLFDQYVPSLKARAYRRLVDAYRKLNPDWSDQKVYEEAAADANERFGGINYKRIGRSAATQDVLRIVALAPDWLESEVRFMARVFGREGKVARRDVATMAVMMWGAARVLNYLTTGQPHMEAPFGVAVKDDEGREKIYSVRTMPTDILHAVQDPMEFLKGRTAPLAKSAIQAYTGRDQWGKKLPGYSMFWDVLQSSLPIPVQSVSKAMATANETSTPDQLWKAAGATVRPYQTEAQKLATTVASDHTEDGPVDPAVIRRHQAVMHFEDEIRAQRMPMQDIYQMVHTGQLPEAEAKKIEKNIKETEGMSPDVARFYMQAKRAPMSDFLRIWDAGTANEKAMLAQLLLAKRKRYFTKARTDMTPAERLSDPVYRRLMEMFPNQPPW